MLARDYDKFVARTDLNSTREREKREDIAIYGLVGEMGALASAVKRRLIAEGTGEIWNEASDEVIEELGDALWYWSLLNQLLSCGSDNLLRKDLKFVQANLTLQDPKGQRFREAVGQDREHLFAVRVKAFLAIKAIKLNEYQAIAYLTRRTEGQVLVGVCLTVLSQLGAELLKKRFPPLEVDLNEVVDVRDVDVILGEVAWHLAAIASTFDLKLADVAKKNQTKIDRRLDRVEATPLHDEDYRPHERFPRQFDISFVTVGKGRLRMYCDGKQLGDELSDNSDEDDGYRFHDVMHLALAANLGWSPVLRDLLKRKRKSDPKTDEIQDGARARIVEEAIIKAIHSEGEKISRLRQRHSDGRPVRLFEQNSEISFKFLGFISSLAQGLESSKNHYWEWEDSIIQGTDVFWRLRNEQQGTVSVDLNKRKIGFDPSVYIEGPGSVVGLGSASVDAQDSGAMEMVARQAILESLGLPLSERMLSQVSVRPFRGGFSVKATGKVQDAIWSRKIISFRTTFTKGPSTLMCTALALA